MKLFKKKSKKGNFKGDLPPKVFFFIGTQILLSKKTELLVCLIIGEVCLVNNLKASQQMDFVKKDFFLSDQRKRPQRLYLTLQSTC